jgi:hypothetical protein
MKLVHFTDDQHLLDDESALPRPIESTYNEGAGLFVYPYREAHMGYHENGWRPRKPTFWSIPAKYVREVQRFRRGELGRNDPPFVLVELFVPVKYFDKLRRIEEP